MQGVDFDAAGNVYAGGYYEGGSIQWGLLTPLPTSGFDQNGVLLKTDPAGVPQWSLSISGGNNQITGVAATPDGDVVTAGYRAGDSSLIVKYSGSDGSIVWYVCLEESEI